MGKKLQINGLNWENNAIPNWYIDDLDILMQHAGTATEASVSAGGYSCKKAIDGNTVNAVEFFPKTSGKISLYTIPILNSQVLTRVVTIEVSSQELIGEPIIKKFTPIYIPEGSWLVIGSSDSDEAEYNTLTWYYSASAIGYGFYMRLGTASASATGTAQCIGFNIGYFPD